MRFIKIQNIRIRVNDILCYSSTERFSDRAKVSMIEVQYGPGKSWTFSYTTEKARDEEIERLDTLLLNNSSLTSILRE